MVLVPMLRLSAQVADTMTGWHWCVAVGLLLIGIPSLLLFVADCVEAWDRGHDRWGRG